MLGASDRYGRSVAERQLAGRWRIVEMDLWDRDAIDLIGRGFIEFFDDGTGQFAFIVVDAYLHCHDVDEDPPRLEFTWEGSDEGDAVSGRGWAELDADRSLRGHIYFHNGDDSGFRAVRQDNESSRHS
jgi:hypothetical protein